MVLIGNWIKTFSTKSFFLSYEEGLVCTNNYFLALIQSAAITKKDKSLYQWRYQELFHKGQIIYPLPFFLFPLKGNPKLDGGICPLCPYAGQVTPLRYKKKHLWYIALKYSPKIQNEICSEKCVLEKIVLRMFTAILEELYSFIMSVFIAWKHGNITDQHVNIITQQKVYWKVGDEFKEKGVLSSCIKKGRKICRKLVILCWIDFHKEISFFPKSIKNNSYLIKK